MFSGLKALLFDIDGTLIDTVSLIVEALDLVYKRHIGVSMTSDEIRATIGLPLSVQVHLLDEYATKTVDYNRMMTDQVEYYEQNKHREFLLNDAVEAVRACSKLGYKIALVTSKNAEEMTYTLPRLNLDGIVSAVITSSDVINPKPAPDPALKALEALDVEPHEACFIGDTTYDIECAKSAGVYSAAVLWGAHPENLLITASADKYFSSPSELLQWCEKLPRLNNDAISKII